MQSPPYREETVVPAKSVFLIDDHPVVALGLRLALRQSNRFHLVGTAGDAHKAIGEIERQQPDAVVVDLVLAGTVELSLVTQCREAARSAAIVVFSSLPARLYEREALGAGADAYLSKENDLSRLMQLLDDLMERPGCRAEHTGTSVSKLAQRETLDGICLTLRESEIGQLLGGGLSINRIAQDIGLSPKTVAAHRDNIRKKLNCRDSNELIARLAWLYRSGDHHG